MEQDEGLIESRQSWCYPEEAHSFWGNLQETRHCQWDMVGGVGVGVGVGLGLWRLGLQDSILDQVRMRLQSKGHLLLQLTEDKG